MSEDRAWTKPQGEPIDYRDIRGGDVVEWSAIDGFITRAEVTHRGVGQAPRALGGEWRLPHEYAYHLVHRPAPAEPTGLGAVVEVELTPKYGAERFVRVHEGEWQRGGGGRQLRPWGDLLRYGTPRVISEGVPK